MASTSLEIRPCDSDLRPQALRHLFEGLSEAQQPGLVRAIDAVAGENQDAWNGLLVATRGRVPVAAIWVQHGAGNTATVWLPATSDVEAEALLRAAREYIDQHGIGLAQILTPADGPVDAGALTATGFPRLVDLIYLYCEASVPTELEPADRDDVEFLPGAGEEPERLKALLQRTYVDSLDCPALDAARPMGDVIATYREQGEYDPARWFFVVRNGVDIGALLLSEHPDAGNWELIYMGVTPEARGRGLGATIASRALQVAALGGAKRLMLAVDQENHHALNAYRAAGFRQWDRQTVYGRLASAIKRT